MQHERFSCQVSARPESIEGEAAPAGRDAGPIFLGQAILGVAAALAIFAAAVMAGLGWLGSALAAWIGGNIAVLAAAARPLRRRRAGSTAS